MNSKLDNPYLFAADPYTDNPFLILGIDTSGASDRLVQFQAEQVEAYAGKLFPETGRIEQPGEAGRAAAAIGSPLARLAFDMMCYERIDEDSVL